MFDKNKFAQILKNINDTYESQREFSKKSDINRTYLSQYMNMKLDEPPKPKTLTKLANASNGLTNYNELMKICGYIYDDEDPYLLYLYETLDDIEQEYINARKKLNTKEYFIHTDLFDQLLKYLHDGHTTPETFDPNVLLNDLDFVSDKSRKRLYNSLKAEFTYFYEENKIKDKINKTKSPNEFPLLSQKYNSFNKYYMCPVYGQISAGQPNWAEECIEGRLPIDPSLMNIVNPEECYFLRVNGESMNKVVKNGAYALIRKTDWVDDGEIAVVLVNGYDATLKKFSRQGDFVVLEPMSNDPTFQTQIYTKDTPIKIIGKYIGKMEMK